MLKKNIIITGSNSFIAGKIIEKYKHKYNFIKLNRKNGYLFQKKIIIKDLNINYLIHTAFIKDIDNDDFNYKANLKGVKNCLNFCRLNNVKFIFLSSFVYGTTIKLPIDEFQTVNPHNAYTKCKLECEKICYEYSDKYKIDSVILRIFNVYGQINNKEFLISNLIHLIKKSKISKKSIFLNDYGIKRDYLHVHDLVKLFDKIIIKGFKKFNIYNVGYGQSYSLEQIVKKTNLILPNITINLKKINNKDLILDTKCNINKIKKAFIWSPKISLYKGIKIALKKND